MLQAQYAAPNSSGTFSSLISWIDFGTTLNLSANCPTAKVTNSIAGGYCISFDISLCSQNTSSGASQIVFSGVPIPISSYTPFGNTAYTGIPGNVALYMMNAPTTTTETYTTLKLSNIQVQCYDGTPLNDYFIVAADSEVTNQSPCTSPELWSLTTNGSSWELLTKMPSTTGCSTSTPRVSGIGTRTVVETGAVSCQENTTSNVFLTKSPTQILANATVSSSRASFSFGVIIPCPCCECTLSAIRSCQINYVKYPETNTFCLPLKCGDRLISITHNGTDYPFNINPVLITGQLGTYLFYNNSVLFNGTPTLYKNTFDIFTLSFQRCHDICTKVIAFASKTSCFT